MSQQANGLAVRSNTPPPIMQSTPNEIAIGSRGVELRTFGDVLRFAEAFYKSGLAPKGFQNAQAVAIVIQCGLELGLTPMQSLQGMHPINNKVGIDGELALALIRTSPACEYINTRLEGTGDFMTGVCVSKRRGDSVERKTTFNVANAKRAGLWGKDGPWRSYPERMLTWRAVGYNGKDYWSEVLKGIPLTDELRDIPGGDVSKSSKVTQIIDVTTIRKGALPQAKAVASDGTEFMVNGQQLIEAATVAMNSRIPVALEIQETPKGIDLLSIAPEPEDGVLEAVLESANDDSLEQVIATADAALELPVPAPVPQLTLKEKIDAMTIGQLLTGFQQHGLPKRVIETRLGKKVSEFTNETLELLRDTYTKIEEGTLDADKAFAN